jgi:hypothetical protein
MLWVVVVRMASLIAGDEEGHREEILGAPFEDEHEAETDTEEEPGSDEGRSANDERIS